MPDKEGKLTSEDKQKVIKYLSREGFNLNPVCPFCGQTKWFVADHLVMPLTFIPGAGVNLGPPGYPFVMIVSTTCGFTQFLNAVFVGVVAHQSEKHTPMAEQQKGGDHV